MTIKEAKEVLLDFLIDCQTQSFRNVLMVHGKGSHSAALKPRLKNYGKSLAGTDSRSISVLLSS